MTVARRAAAAAAWSALAAGAGALASPWAHVAHRRTDTLHVVSRSLVPWAGLMAAPAAAVARRTRSRPLAVAAALVGAAGLATAAWVAGRPRPAADDGASMSVAHFNLLFLNERLERDTAVMAALDADVLTFCELTPRHLETLLACELAERYPHRLEDPGPYARGTGLWSKFPVVEVDGPELEHHTVAADVDAPEHGHFRIVVIHTRSPLHHLQEWGDDLRELAGEPAPTDRPAVLLGDFNAAWGHPELRAIAAAGWRDAHRVLGRGLTSSWPAHRRWHPPFVRLDHALVNDRIEVVDVADVDLPGSDHRGLVVNVRAAPPPWPPNPRAP